MSASFTEWDVHDFLFCDWDLWLKELFAAVTLGVAERVDGVVDVPAQRLARFDVANTVFVRSTRHQKGRPAHTSSWFRRIDIASLSFIQVKIIGSMFITEGIKSSIHWSGCRLQNANSSKHNEAENNCRLHF